MSRTAHRFRVLEAAVALTLSSAMLKALPFRLVARLVGSTTTGLPVGPPPASSPAARAIGRAVEAAARRLPWKPVCLPQSLAASLMLRRRGQSSRLCLGVRREDGRIAAHAWLLAGADGTGGVVCGGRNAADFVPIATLRPDALG
jgi:hypothetical protein